MSDKNVKKTTLRDVFSPTFVAISLINFLGMTGYFAIFVIMTSYANEALNNSMSIAGLITGIVVIGCLVGRFFSGSIVNSFGFIRLLFIGLVLYLFTNLGYFYINSTVGLLLLRFISGCATGIIGTVTGTVVAIITPKSFLARGIAFFSLSNALAICIGPFLGIALLPKLSYNAIFAIASGLSFCSLLLLSLVRVPKETLPKRTKKKIELSDFIDKKLIPFSLVIALFCFAWGNLQAFMAAYAKEFNVQEAASIFFLVYAAVIIATRPVTGKICDTHGPGLIFYPAILALALGLGLLYFFPTNLSVIISGVLMGFGFGNIQSIGQASAVAMVPRERYAQATSTYFIFFDFGVGISPYISGYFVSTLGCNGIYGATAILVLLGLPLYYLVTKRAGKVTAGERLRFKKEDEKTEI